MTDQPASYQPSPPPEAAPTRKGRQGRLPRGGKKKKADTKQVTGRPKRRKKRADAVPTISRAVGPMIDLLQAINALSGLSIHDGKVLASLVSILKDLESMTRRRVVGALNRMYA